MFVGSKKQPVWAVKFIKLHIRVRTEEKKLELIYLKYEKGTFIMRRDTSEGSTPYLRHPPTPSATPSNSKFLLRKVYKSFVRCGSASFYLLDSVWKIKKINKLESLMEWTCYDCILEGSYKQGIVAVHKMLLGRRFASQHVFWEASTSSDNMDGSWVTWNDAYSTDKHHEWRPIKSTLEKTRFSNAQSENDPLSKKFVQLLKQEDERIQIKNTG